MTQARLDSLGEGRFSLRGVLSKEVIPALWQQGQELWQGLAEVRLDLADLQHCDSAGLAMLIDWLRIARQRPQRLTLANIPAQIHDLARLSDLEVLLGDDRDPPD